MIILSKQLELQVTIPSINNFYMVIWFQITNDNPK